MSLLVCFIKNYILYIYIYLCNNQHKSDVVEIDKGQMNDVLLQSGLLITQPLWEAH